MKGEASQRFISGCLAAAWSRCGLLPVFHTPTPRRLPLMQRGSYETCPETGEKAIL